MLYDPGSKFTMEDSEISARYIHFHLNKLLSLLHSLNRSINSSINNNLCVRVNYCRMSIYDQR